MLTQILPSSAKYSKRFNQFSGQLGRAVFDNSCRSQNYQTFSKMKTVKRSENHKILALKRLKYSKSGHISKILWFPRNQVNF